ncbi:MAG TPA: ankyrin repeat domain-containing protein [Puia sp.]|nr:ankyrin repeat domain-containing protein [Puia sp.]
MVKSPSVHLPVIAGVKEYRRQAEELFAAYMSGDPGVRVLIDEHHPRLRRLSAGEENHAAVTVADIQLAMADWYCLESWPHLEEWAQEACSPGSRVSSFEAAADAILSGDTANLGALLRLYPSLVRLRSMRRHHATLLHYIAANGVEYDREQYPKNAVELLDLLLAAGANVDATADMYGGGATTIGLVATSIHPAKAGVLIPLLDRLIAAGAALDMPDVTGNQQYIVNSCLANGRPEAAAYLSRRGAYLDLEGAAGVGRLDIVETYFQTDGALKRIATRSQMGAALNWASEYGHSAVVNYLMDRGADPAESIDGMHALHMALLGGHLDTIRLLIKRGAPLEARNRYGGTPLGMALWAIRHRDPVHTWPEKKVDNVGVIEALLSGGAEVGPGILATLQWQPRNRLKTEIERLLLRFGIEPWKE